MNSRILTLAFAAVLTCTTAFAQDSKPTTPPTTPPATPKKEDANKVADITKDLKDGIYVVFETNRGVMVAEMYYTQTPMTCANFIGLAEGTLDWTDAKTGAKKTKTPYFNGLNFHRVIPKFMIQGGCPLGNGMGGPGYKFADEIVEGLKHGSAGILSMANSGPATNGSQFFITLVPTPFLDGKHTVFGKLVKGTKTLEAIGATGSPRGQPTAKSEMNKVTVLRVGDKAKAWKYAKATKDWQISTVAKKDVPEVADDKIDAAKLPSKDAKQADSVNVEFIFILYKGARGAKPLAPSKEDAIKRAAKVVRLARSKDADFAAIAKDYSDQPTSGRKEDLGFSPRLPKFYLPVLKLQVGQVSDPIETPQGIIIFKCNKISVHFGARHLLFSYKGTRIRNMTRTKEEAKKLAEDMLAKIKSKAITWDDALKQSNHSSPKGNL
ncbi:MAG: peptidylprolyl isomerase, partial [Planctomycetota bacterium]|nr:peptidylprolyl isomerase [Planctomycetota bacterium]